MAASSVPAILTHVPRPPAVPPRANEVRDLTPREPAVTQIVEEGGKTAYCSGCMAAERERMMNDATLALAMSGGDDATANEEGGAGAS